MSQVHYVVYDTTTGAVRRSGLCQDYDLEKQAQPGEGVMLATADAIVVAEVNLQPVKDSAAAQVDAAAETQRETLITGGSGQAMTYMAKNAEALGWLANNAYPTPFLSAEAAAIGSTVAALAAEVRNAASAWATEGSAIEAKRRKSKMAIQAATNVAEIHAAMQVDWSALTKG